MTKEVLLLLLLIYLSAGSVLDMRIVKKMKDTVITETIRVKFYRKIIIGGWIPLFAALLLCLFSGIGFFDVGLRQTSITYGIWFSTITFVICGGLSAVLLYQIISYLVSEKYRTQAKEHFSNTAPKNYYIAVMNNIMIPRSKKEKQLFFGVSLTAGISEEIIYRGLLYYLLQAVFPNLPIAIVVIAASVLFGIGHIYQGFYGLVKTTIIGALFGCLYLAADSVIPGILLHFFVDYAGAFLLSEDCSRQGVNTV